MRITCLTYFLVFLLTGFISNLYADVELARNSLMNEKRRLTGIHSDEDLMKYLQGSWEVEGEWKVIEPNEDQMNIIHAVLEGVEHFKPVLNNHFLQKRFCGFVEFLSDVENKKTRLDFSSLTLFSFDSEKRKFFFRYFDSQGEVMQAEGAFRTPDQTYVFIVKSYDEKGETVESLYDLKPIDYNQFNWTIREKNSSTDVWQVAASGTGRRNPR